MVGLREIYNIVKELQSCSSTKAKQHILSKNKDNELFREILVYTYDTNLQYGIKQKTIDKMKFTTTEKDKWNTNVWKMLDELADSNINNTLVWEVEKLLCYFDDECRDLIIRVLLKDLRCNISVKTINTAIPGLIHQHQVMLASKFEGKIKGRVSISLKMDGIRNSALIEKGNIKHISRQGKIVDGLEEINNALREFDLDGYFVDGELIRINKEGIPSDDNFRLTTKIVNSKSFYKEGLEFVIFDIVPIEDYYMGKSGLTYEKRLQLMEELIGEGNEFIRLVPKFGITDDVNEIYEKLDEVVSNGEEGLILNTLIGVYAFGKRPKDILKVKKFREGDLLVVGITEGTGKYANMVGALKCEFIYNGEICECEVGSGLLDEERKLLFDNPLLILNKIITIKFFEVSKDDKTKKHSLRFPTINLRYPDLIRIDKSSLEDTNVD